MRKLKLLFYDFNMPYLVKDSDHPVGGATVEWYAWLKGLEANNCEVSALTWKGAKNYVGDKSEVSFIESYDLNQGVKKLKWFYRVFAIYNAIKKYNPDYIIQECAGFETGIIAFTAKILKIPFIYRVANDIDTDDRIKKRLNYRQRIFFHYGLRNTSAIVCQNEYQYEKINEKFQTTPKLIIGNPFYSNEELPPIVAHKKRSYVAWIGIFQYQKNLPLLYEIVKMMPNVKFKIAGKAVSKNQDLNTEKALKKLCGCVNVQFIGFLKRKEVLPFLARSYVLLNTSFYEGFSNTYIESLAAGTPILANINAEPDSIISDNGLGISVKSSDEYVGAIDSIIKNEHYNAMAKNCREFLIQNHGASKLAKKFIRFLSSI